MSKNEKSTVTNPKQLGLKKDSQKYNRTFSEALRKQIVASYEKKQATIREICDLYGISRTSVYKWIYLYSSEYQAGTKQVVQMESEAQKTKALLRENAELLQAIGRKQLEIDYLNQVLLQASQDLNVDLKKNFASKASNGLKNTKPNIDIE